MWVRTHFPSVFIFCSSGWCMNSYCYVFCITKLHKLIFNSWIQCRGFGLQLRKIDVNCILFLFVKLVAFFDSQCSYWTCGYDPESFWCLDVRVATQSFRFKTLKAENILQPVEHPIHLKRKAAAILSHLPIISEPERQVEANRRRANSLAASL